MNQADVSKLVSKIRFKVNADPRRLSSPEGPEGRINKLRKTVTGLIKYERIELNYNRADEARQYAERLISEAIRYGDCHKQTMDYADFWLLEKELVHKLFKVLVPRYEASEVSFTKLYRAPRLYPAKIIDRAVLELRGNPYPSLTTRNTNTRLLIQNVLLDAAKSDYRQSKYIEMANNIGKNDSSHSHSNADAEESQDSKQ